MSAAARDAGACGTGATRAGRLGPPALAVLCGLAAASCAAAQDAAPRFARYDGTYRGRFAPLAGSRACPGTGGPVRLEVSGTHVWSDSRQKHRRLDGTVTQAGELGLVSEDGRRLVSGTISGGRLTATETMPGPVPAGPFVDAAAAPCISRIDASLAAPG